MIIHESRNLWNFNSFSNCKFLCFSKWYNFRKLMIFEIVKFGKSLELSELEVFENSKIGMNFLEFSK